MTDTLQQANAEKLMELREDARQQALDFNACCFGLSLPFRVLEVYRTQKRQNDLHKIGRSGVPGQKPVTWTLTSNHTSRLAFDIVPVGNSTFNKIAEVAARFDIIRPKELVKLGDLGHFEVQPGPTLAQRVKDAMKAINRVTESRRKSLGRFIERALKILGSG